MDEPQRTDAQFQVSLALPWLLKLPDSTFEAQHGRNRYLLATKAYMTSVGETASDEAAVLFRPMSGQLTAAAGARVPGAMLHYTEATIGFFKQIRGPAVAEDDTKKVLAIARTCLNHFLDVYRFIARDTDVRPFSLREFHEVRAGRGLLVQSIVKRADGGGTLASGVYFDEKEPILLSSPPPLGDPAVTELREHLKAGHTPALSQLLLLNSEMYLQAGQTRLAVIDMNAALDVLVEQKAQMWLLHNGLSAADVNAKLEKKNTVAIMRDILLPNLEVPPGSDFPWDEWFGKHRHLRNRVVHDAYEPKPEEARESFDNVNRLCRFIRYPQIGTKDGHESQTRA